MSAADFVAISPLLALTLAAVALVLAIAMRRSHALAASICALGLVASLAGLLCGSLPYADRMVTPLLTVDGYAVFYMTLLILAALGVTVISHGYLAAPGSPVPRDEYYVLLLLATLGAATTVCSAHFAAFFLGLETLSIALLGLIAYPRRLERPLEASVKYLVLSGVASAFLLFGIALVYAETGTLAFDAMTGPGAAAVTEGRYGLAGVALIVVGVGFKLSVVPFHMWAPDVYEGAPAPVGAFLAVVSKCAVFALLLRYFLTAEAFASPNLVMILSVIAILSMIAGNLAALLQDNVKRILAYSSIAHLGYALVAFLAGGEGAVEAVSIYLAMYAITTLGAFTVVAMLPRPADGREAEMLEDYRGLFWARPWVAAAFAAMLLSLAGIPLTLGFIAKFYAVAAGVGASLWVLVSALVVGSVVSLYYYLRIAVVMLAPYPGTARAAPASNPLPRASAALLVLLTAALLGLGVFPRPLIALVRASASELGANVRTPSAGVASSSPAAQAGDPLLFPFPDAMPSAGRKAPDQQEPSRTSLY